MPKWKMFLAIICLFDGAFAMPTDAGVVEDVIAPWSNSGASLQEWQGRIDPEMPPLNYKGAQSPNEYPQQGQHKGLNFIEPEIYSGNYSAAPSSPYPLPKRRTGPAVLNSNITKGAINNLDPARNPLSSATTSPPVVTNRYRPADSAFSSGPPAPPPQGFTNVGVAPRYSPGGISLSKAAAERMPLDIDIDSLAYRDGQVVLSGARHNATRLDAALFLTSLRLACSPDEPTFSLDPVDGAAWSDQGREALKLIWDRVKDSYSRDSGASGFAIETFSVKRHYPSIWAELEPRYPELRTRLVFRPAELRETRFGEILYRADVLLKELASGVSVLEPNASLRARRIPGYIPADQRSAARSVLIARHSKESRGWRGHRLWFDLLPQTIPDEPVSYQDPDSELERSKHRNLYSILNARGFVGGRAPKGLQKTAFSVSDDVVDVSEVYPKMFVRRHDHATGQDISGADPDLDLLSGDVNARTALYVNAYQELHDLTDVFRAYVASVKIAQQNARICVAVRGLPLSEGEKVTTPLPEHHASELFITVAKYVWSERGGRRSLVWGGNSINGGIALRGKEFTAVAAIEQETPIIRQVKQTLATGAPKQRWDDSSRRQYLAFNLDSREPVRRAPIVATARGK